jgi:hypothetical protein
MRAGCTAGDMAVEEGIFASLPQELLEQVLSRCAHALGSPSRVCTQWRAAAQRAEVAAAALCLLYGDGANALVHSARHGREDVVRALLSSGAARADDYSAQPTAAQHGHLGVVRLLTEWPQHAAQSTWAMMAAARHGQLAVVDYLVERCLGDPDRLSKEAPNALKAAASEGQEAIVQRLLAVQHAFYSRFCRCTVLNSAADKGHIGVVRMLLAAMPFEEWQLGVALSSASGAGHEEIVQLLQRQMVGALGEV